MYKNKSLYVRNPKVAERIIDDSSFLVDTENDTVFYLNTISTGIWKILKDPTSLSDTINIVQQAFPDLPSNKIEKDVSKLIKKMHSRNLIHIVS